MALAHAHTECDSWLCLNFQSYAVTGGSDPAARTALRTGLQVHYIACRMPCVTAPNASLSLTTQALQQAAHHLTTEEDEVLLGLVAEMGGVEEHAAVVEEAEPRERQSFADTTKEKLLRFFHKDDRDPDAEESPNASTNSFGSIFRKKV